MLYLKEIYYRILFIFFNIFISVFVLYLYKENLINLVVFPIFFKNLNNSNYSFICTNPTEVSIVILKIYLLITFILTLPFVIWSIVDFLKSSLTISEFIKIKILYYYLICIIVTNILFFIILFPIIWSSFEDFNLSYTVKFNISQELKLEEYFAYFFNYLCILNTILILMSILAFVSVYLGISFLIRSKKFQIFFNIIIATIISPPDIYTQICIFFFLQLFIEIIQFILIFINKLLIRQ